MPQILLAGATAFLVLGSLSVILGFKARFGALLLLTMRFARNGLLALGWEKISRRGTEHTELSASSAPLR